MNQVQEMLRLTSADKSDEAVLRLSGLFRLMSQQPGFLGAEVLRGIDEPGTLLVLHAWRDELVQGVSRTVHNMQDETVHHPDPNDRATQESEFGLELRTRDRERKLLRKIDAALQRIDDGSYGYCAETGEEIGLRRLEARPVATLCVEAQERRELARVVAPQRRDGVVVVANCVLEGGVRAVVHPRAGNRDVE